VTRARKAPPVLRVPPEPKARRVPKDRSERKVPLGRLVRKDQGVRRGQPVPKVQQVLRVR